MFRKRNILTKAQWMGISALIMALVMILNPVLSMAEEGSSDGEILIFSSDGTETVAGGSGSGSNSGSSKSSSGTDSGTISGSSQGKASDIITADDIWALVDYDELRSLIDEDELRSRIDVVALLDNIDKDELRNEIDPQALLDTLSEDDLQSEFVQRKLEGEFFILDPETGEGRIVDEQEYNALKTAGESKEDKAEKPLSEVIEEETQVLEDGREVTTYKLKIDQDPEEYIEEHPVDVTNVQLPVLGDVSPFDFLIDPLQLVFQTSAAKYGGGIVEEGASILFRNSEGEYDFSHKSDRLTVVNKGNIPVKVIVTANIKNPESILLVGDESDLNGDLPCIYMALEDENGDVSVLSNNGDAVIEKVLKAAPDDIYQYTLNEETGEYDHDLNKNAENIGFDSFTFGVFASCNTEADWEGVDTRPIINVNWKIEPILTDWDYINAGLMDKEKERLLADTEQFEAFKLVKTGELVEEKLLELTQIKLDELKEAEFEVLLQEELANLADDKLEEIIEEKGLQDRFVVEEHESKSDQDKTKGASSDDEEKNQDAKAESSGSGEKKVLGARREYIYDDDVEEPDAVTFAVDSLNDPEDSSDEFQDDSDEVIFIDGNAGQKADSSVIFFNSSGN